MKTVVSCGLILMLLAAGPAWGQEKVAVLDFKSIMAPEELGMAVAEILRTELIGMEDYTIVERGMLESIIEEQALQLSGVMDSATAVEIGRLAGADLVVTGSLVKTGSVYTINARFIEVETGIARVGQNIRGEGDDEISNMVHQLALVITGQTVAAEEKIETAASREPARASDDSGDLLLFSFETPPERNQWDFDAGRSRSKVDVAAEHATDGDYALHAQLRPFNDWQTLSTANIPADWSAYALLSFEVYYAGDSEEALPLVVRLDDERTNRLQQDWFLQLYSLYPGPNTVQVYIDEIGASIDIRQIKQLIISTNKLRHAADLYLDHLRLRATRPPAPSEPFLLSFETGGEAAVNFQANGRLIKVQQADTHATDGAMAMKLGLPRKLPANAYPGVESMTFPRDWSQYQTFRMDVFVADTLKEALTCVIRIDDADSDSYETRFHWEGSLETGANHLEFSVAEVARVLDLSRIVRVHLFLDEPTERTTLYVDNIVLE